jgi:hypothetical protein
MLDLSPRSPGLLKFRAPSSAPLTNVAQQLKAGSGKVCAVFIQSPIGNVIPTFIKFYDALAANVTPGTTIPVKVLCVPAYVAPQLGTLQLPPGFFELHHFDTAISVLATSVQADTGTQTAPTTGVIAEISFI